MRWSGSLISLLILVSIPHYATATEPCLKLFGTRGTSGPRNRKGSLSMCREHELRTCCTSEQTTAILQESRRSDLSPACREMSERVWCSLCDGDVGIGQKWRGGKPILCENFCKEWYVKCSSDFFAPGSIETGVSEPLAPCGHADIVCSPLTEITSDYVEFCKRSNFDVADEDPKSCYAGITAASTKSAAPKEPRKKVKAAPRRRIPLPPMWLVALLISLFWACFRFGSSFVSALDEIILTCRRLAMTKQQLAVERMRVAAREEMLQRSRLLQEASPTASPTGAASDCPETRTPPSVAQS